MAGAEQPRESAEPLANTEGVVDAGYPRKLQTLNGGFYTHLPKEFCRAMGLTEQGQAVDFKRVTGSEKVVIDEPAIVIRPHPNGARPDGE